MAIVHLKNQKIVGENIDTAFKLLVRKIKGAHKPTDQ